MMGRKLMDPAVAEDLTKLGDDLVDDLLTLVITDLSQDIQAKVDGYTCGVIGGLMIGEILIRLALSGMAVSEIRERLTR